MSTIRTEASEQIDDRGPASPSARQFGLIALIYAIATALTSAHFMADTVDYVESVLTFKEFWEFGHLFWRPLAWLLYQACYPLTEKLVGPAPEASVTFVMVAMNWAAGLMSVTLMYALLGRVTRSHLAAQISAAAFALSHGFLNFAQTGSSYVPGLSFLILGLYVLARAEGGQGRPRWAPVAAGVAFALSACFWFLYVWAIPGALALPIILSGAGVERRRLAIRAAVVFAVAMAVAYGAVLARLGIHDAEGLRAWVASASHGVTHINGATRVLFGIPRSFVDMGDSGVAVKRFLVGDSFNPVSLPELAFTGVWALALFYACAAAVAFSLLRRERGRRSLALLMAGSIPMVAFAVMFDGAAIERYLPTYPFAFLALSAFLACDRPPASLKVAVVMLIAGMSAANLFRMSAPVLSREQELIAARVSGLTPALKPESVIVTVDIQDGLVKLRRSFPFNPVARQIDARITSLVLVGTEQVSRWEKEFARQALSAWRRGGDVWITKRVFSPRPREEWGWVEGADARVSWADFFDFFSGLQMAEDAGGEDGFVLVAPSPANEKLLASRLAEGGEREPGVAAALASKAKHYWGR